MEVAFLSAAESSGESSASFSLPVPSTAFSDAFSDEFVWCPDCDLHICRCPNVSPHVHLPSVVGLPCASVRAAVRTARVQVSPERGQEPR